MNFVLVGIDLKGQQEQEWLQHVHPENVVELTFLVGWKEVILVLWMDEVIEGSVFAGTTIVVPFPLPSKLGTVVRSMCITFMVSLH